MEQSNEWRSAENSYTRVHRNRSIISTVQRKYIIHSNGIRKVHDE